MPIPTASAAEIKRITAQGRRARGQRSLTQWNDQRQRNQRTTQRRRPK